MYRFLIVFFLAVVVNGAITYDYYDINEVFNEFTVDCGTVDEPKMVILYGGNAYSMYAVDEPVECQAQEVAPAVFRIDINYDDTKCPIESSGEPPVKMLNLVVQKGMVRQFSDPFKQITCNYGLGGQQQSSDTDTNEGNLVPRQPVWDTANDAVTLDEVSLTVYGTDNQEVSTAYLGAYIQLRAFIEDKGDDGEHSIKIFNCRAYTNTMSYYMLLAGCGEGDVIASNRGFRTQLEAGYPDFFRVARSSYFKSFLLPGEDTISFECDYILCTDLNQCDGLSCPDSVSANSVGARRKRSTETAGPKYPTVSTNAIRLIKKPEQMILAESSELVREEPETIGQYKRAYEPGMAADLEVVEYDLLKMALIAGVAFLAVVLLVLVTVVCIRARGSSPAPYLPQPAPFINDSVYSKYSDLSLSSQKKPVA